MSLNANNLSYSYNKNDWIFRSIDLKIEYGNIVGLLAPSGYGKSTLAKILSGYFLPDRGEVRVDNKQLELKGFCPVQLVFQQPEKTLNPKLKIEKSLNESWQVDSRIMKKLGIKREWLYRWPNELSTGEKQRICIARALDPRTKFLIADEISTMLDAITQVEIWNFLKEEVKERKLGILAISHDEDLLNQVSDQLVYMEDL